jgi:DNA helicase-2/ATP-dependent DNA helicase PcrA
MARTRSPWLDDVEAAADALAAAGTGLGPDWRRHLAVSRARIADAEAAAREARAARRRSGRRVEPEIGRHADPALLKALRAWRANTARAAVAEARPRSRDALLAIPGMGPVKADRYGQAMLELVASAGAHASAGAATA